MNKFGFEAKLYWGAAGSTASTELTILRNCTVNQEATEGETTTRGTGGVKTYAAGLKDWTLELEIANSPDDSGFAALQSAYNDRSLIAVLALDETDGWGVDADWVVTGFNRTEDLDDIQGVSVTLRPAYGTRAPAPVTGASV